MQASKSHCDPLDILSDKRVLYAEDEQGVRQNVAEALELFFDKAVAVSDGEEALNEAMTGNYDLLMFDISMPNIDGLDAIKAIRKFDKKIPIIILSAHTEQEYLWRAVELKITKYLTKPYSKESLIDALNTATLEMIDDNIVVQLTTTCRYNRCNKTVKRGDNYTALSRSESRLLEHFINKANQPVTFDEIYHYLWEFETPSKEAIKSIVKELRKKVDRDLIKSVYGVGYLLEL